MDPMGICVTYATLIPLQNVTLQTIGIQNASLGPSAHPATTA